MNYYYYIIVGLGAFLLGFFIAFLIFKRKNNDFAIYSMLNDFKGGLTENYVFTQLKAKNIDLYYWTNENQAEIDFIARIGKDIIPIEVKASDNIRSKSLMVFMKRFNPPYAIRISAKNFGFENGIKSVPLYAVFCI